MRQLWLTIIAFSYALPVLADTKREKLKTFTDITTTLQDVAKSDIAPTMGVFFLIAALLAGFKRSIFMAVGLVVLSFFSFGIESLVTMAESVLVPK